MRSRCVSQSPEHSSQKTRLGLRRVARFNGFRLMLMLFLTGTYMPSVHAQVSASIAGTITDSSGAPGPSATVKTSNVETGATRSSVTDDAGRYLVLALPVGEYEVRVLKAGFQDGIRK